MTECKNCDGTGWVCENHINKPWGGVSCRADACECGAGEPCGSCVPYGELPPDEAAMVVVLVDADDLPKKFDINKGEWKTVQ